MIGKVIRIFCLVLLPCSVYASSWYVDPNASGANSGTSWANAWKSFNSINWSAVLPGDTVYLSGGTTSQTYTSVLTIPKSGTAGNQITIAAGQDPGHNGIVTFDAGGGNAQMINTGGFSYITINGNYNGNRHILMQNGDLTYSNPMIYGSGSQPGSQGNHIEYVEIKHSGSGIMQNFYNAVEIDHSYVHDITCEVGIAINGSLNQYVGTNLANVNLYDLGALIHDNTIQVNNLGVNNGIGPDAIQGTFGISIYNNTIFGAPGTMPSQCAQHQDGAQAGQFFKIYNNYEYGFANSVFESDWDQKPCGNLRFYNNVIGQSSTQLNSHGVEPVIRPGCNRMTDVQIMNNTFTDQYGSVAIHLADDSGGTLASYDNINVENNIFYNTGPYNMESLTCGTGIIIDHNNVNAGPDGTATGTCNGSAYNDTNRVTAAPSFVSYSEFATGTNNLHLASSSTMDKGVGANLSSLFTTDKDGSVRTIWDLGAYNFGGGAGVGQPAPPSSLTATVQ